MYAVVAVFALALLVACGGGGGTTTQPLHIPVVGPTPTPSPTPFNGKLYVEYGTPGAPFASGIAAFQLPLSSQSTPVFSLQATFGPIAFDQSGDLFTGVQSEIDVYTSPLSNRSVATPEILAGPASLPSAVSDLQFDPLGNLWVQTTNDLREFPAPLTAGETATTIVGGGGASLSFNPQNGTLYDGPIALPFGNVPSIHVFAAYPYTVPPKTVSPPFGAPIGFDPSGNALVYTNGYYDSNGRFQPSGLALAALPLSNSSLPLFVVPFTLFSGQSNAHTAVNDPLGNVYAIDNSNAVVEFAAPFVAASAPSARVACIKITSSCAAALAVGIGP